MTATSSNSRRKTYFSDSRLLSAFEFVLGAAIVIGYNVFHVIPNEVLILAPLGLLSVWLRNGSLSAIGFKRPASWTRVVLIALAAAALRIGLAAFVIDPLTARFFPPANDPAGMELEKVAGNIKYALLLLGFVWVFAAFGEEIAYRGYLLTRAADVGRRTTAAYWVGVVLVAVLFGFGHFYKGPSGIIDTGFSGLILGAAYLLSGRILWTSILAHGFIDTFGVIALYFGWDS